ncbi:hypothetical protein RvY_16958 [Ramazzottius varieornatus]|uniref:Uncharacterized protein n=1 Tax=Ramazzottius varieornatus TaxID=947166 RepID=A0A1D1W1B7_RAMVA|nr:hypothetical protein RvY_16958 [Ramazzottius varieornatus]
MMGFTFLMHLPLIFLAILCQRCSSTVLTAFETNHLPISNFTREGRATKNFDGRYRPWPNPTAIPYIFDTANPYTAAEQAVITAAMNQISSQMSNCIRFSPTGSATTGSGLFISKSAGAQPAPTTCQTVPGQHYNALNRPQRMVMIPNTGAGNNGCLTQREAMKLLVNVLGLRDEWRRPGRDNCITVNPTSIDPAIGSSLAGQPVNSMTDAYGITGNGAVDVMGTTYDFWSITIPAPDKWKNPNAATGASTPLWTYSPNQAANCPTPAGSGTGGVISPGPISPGTGGTVLPVPPPGTLQAQLSLDDCRGIQAIYPASCGAVLCRDLYNNLTPPTAPLVAQPLPAAPVTSGTGAGTGIGTGNIISGTPTGSGTGLTPQFDANGNPILGGPGG